MDGRKKNFILYNVWGDQKTVKGTFGTHSIFSKQMPITISIKTDYVPSAINYDFVTYKFSYLQLWNPFIQSFKQKSKSW